MKLAVRKEEGCIPGAGFHYLLHIMPMEDDQSTFFEMLDYVILEVPDDQGERLLKSARAALHHQCEVALLTERALQKKRMS